MTKNGNQIITWTTLKNLLPLIGSIITITISWMSLSNKIDLLTQRVETLIESQKTIIVKYEDVQKRLGVDELKIAQLEVILGSKK